MSILPKSEFVIYGKVVAFGLIVFGLLFVYTTKLGIPEVVEKSIADTSIILIGLSMWLGSLTFFFNVFDRLIKFRKQLGLVGFAFGFLHVVLELSALKRVFNPEVWQTQIPWAPLTGLFATGIFIIMTMISNRWSMLHLGVLSWRRILRTGYIAVLLVLAHIILLKSARWMTWLEGGMKSLPSTSLLISIFLVIVVTMRVLLWLRLSTKRTA